MGAGGAQGGLKGGPRKTLSVKHTLKMMPLLVRYCIYYTRLKMKKRKPIMDFIKLEEGKKIYGCPIGGIGTGTIGRGFKGEFCRFQLQPGIYEYMTIPEDQFIINIKNEKNDTIFQSVLSTYAKPKNSPTAWDWKLNESDSQYTALYPQAWTTYDLKKYGVMLTCKQISPVIPHNYKDSSLPSAVFVWDVTNVCNESRTVSITFTFRSVPDPDRKRNDGELAFERYSDSHTCGVSMEQKISGMPCTFTISKKKQPSDSTTDGFCKFNVKKTSGQLWTSLNSKGRLMPADLDGKHPPDAMGLTSQVTVEAGSNGKLEFCLVWDMPVVNFRNNTRKYNRFYTKFFGTDGIAGASIATYALTNYKRWEEEINDWQKPILEDENLPKWYKSALMNELYYISDGGSIWFDGGDQYPKEDPRSVFGMFGYLEGHEYRMYNTYDVHFYASFALAQLWPNLQVSLQYQFKDTVANELTSRVKFLADGETNLRKTLNCIPHDMGDPEEEPFILYNAYNIHNVSEWRDLNLKFILQVFRDFTILKMHKMKRDNLDKYQSLEYIDEDADEEEDLYFRSTNQDIDEVFNLNLNDTIAAPIRQPRQGNGFCRNSESESLVPPRVNKRIKYISISSTDYMDEDLSYMRRTSLLGKNTINSQTSETNLAVEGPVFDSNQYLRDMYPVCRKLMDTIFTWDKDGDGVIENTASADQTYDAWVMSGPSAYCGGLWLAVLQCMIKMAALLGIEGDVNLFKSALEKGKASFHNKLWNGKYYAFDANNPNVIMTDQLCGHWYLRACGFQYSVFPKDNVKSALKTIFDNNVMQFGGGMMGAVNGFVSPTADKPGYVDKSSIQSEEAWTGVTYGVAALMIHEGMLDEAFKTAGGMNETLIKLGMQFETPEALYENGEYRSVGYMRPLSIWAMQHALNAIVR